MSEEEDQLSDDFGPRRHEVDAALDAGTDDQLELDDEELDAGVIVDESDADEDDEDVSARYSERADGESDGDRGSEAAVEGEPAEREVLKRDDKSRRHRQPTGMPPPTKRIAARRKSSRLKGGTRRRAKER